MCGIAGFISKEPSAREQNVRILQRMTDALHHRGPDDRGIWINRSAQVGLGHRRLAILDLSSEGHQPMTSKTGRFTVVFNGEIYNFLQLRSQLRVLGCTFRGQSDTEVLVAAIETWGIDRALARVNGMLAVAVWDRDRDEVHLARDRIGKKPLYYGWAGESLVFGSELKALMAHPDFEMRIDRASLSLLLRYGYIPAPWSIFAGTRKVEAGMRITIPVRRLSRSRDLDANVHSFRYWNARDEFGRAAKETLDIDDDAAIDLLERTLCDAVESRMHSDVRLGAFLSGGTDSSTVVALMQRERAEHVTTFAVGFDDRKHDELDWARAVAAQLGTDHVEVQLKSRDAIELVPQLPQLFDEPFADSSAVPMALLARTARQVIKVALSGDGGDEGFCGYPRYLRAARIWNLQRHVPAQMKRFASAWFCGSQSGEPRVSRWSRFASELACIRPEDVYRNRVSRWFHPERIVAGSFDHMTTLTDPARYLRETDAITEMMYLDLATYVPEDILTKVDRASMAVGLEVRAPLLDHHVLDLAFRLPLRFKIRGGQQKWILKQLLRRHLPDYLVFRPKRGLGAPVSAWLRGDLREWANPLLDRHRLEHEGYFAPAAVEKIWKEFLAGQSKWHTHLWTILMFQAWQEQMAARAVDVRSRPRVESEREIDGAMVKA